MASTDYAKARIELRAFPSNVGTDVRGAMSDVDGLVADISRFNNVESAAVLEYPFNLEETSQLKGTVVNSEYISLSDETDFKIEVILRYAAG